MSNNKEWKDRWIVDAIKRRYLVVERDGTIWRCLRADEDGNLLSKEYRKVKQQVHKRSGRVYFNMTWRGITKSVLVNRVVALCYLPNPNKLEQVNHIDGNKENNAVWNLEWASGSENERHAHRTGLKSGRGSANSQARLTAAQVLEIRAAAEKGESSAEIARRYGIGRSTVVNIVSRRTWTHI